MQMRPFSYGRQHKAIDWTLMEHSGEGGLRVDEIQEIRIFQEQQYPIT